MTELAVAITYAVVGCAHIILSTLWASRLSHMASTQVEMAKGIAFVLLSAILILFIMRRLLGRDRELREQLLRHERALAQADRRASLGILAASVGHEINNTLAIAQASLELMNMGDSSPLTNGDLQGAIDRLAQQARSLLNLGRPAKNLRKDRVELELIVHDVVRVLATTGRFKSVRVTWSQRDPVAVVGDPMALSQIVLNVLLNAADATGGAGHVTLGLSAKGEQAVLTISDDGAGVDESVRGQLFHSYVTSKGSDGTGLGLMVSRTIARRHGGDLVLADAGGQGRGATFALQLPLAPEPTAPAA